MSFEIEKKYVLTEKQRGLILAKLDEIEAKFVRQDFEENILYEGGILTDSGAVLRVRKVNDLTMLTYKLRVANDTDIKQQIEYETRVENAGEIEKIIESLGFEKSLVYEKRRKIWRLRDVEIVLDELPFGQFMEIEGAAVSIVETEKLLNAEDFTTEHLTYPQLTQRFGVRNLKIIEARFHPKIVEN